LDERTTARVGARLREKWRLGGTAKAHDFVFAFYPPPDAAEGFRRNTRVAWLIRSAVDSLTRLVSGEPHLVGSRARAVRAHRPMEPAPIST
jgi:hypothetical protein